MLVDPLDPAHLNEIDALVVGLLRQGEVRRPFDHLHDGRIDVAERRCHTITNQSISGVEFIEPQPTVDDHRGVRGRRVGERLPEGPRRDRIGEDRTGREEYEGERDGEECRGGDQTFRSDAPQRTQPRHHRTLATCGCPSEKTN